MISTILSDANPKSPFRTPDGYFDDFTVRLMQRIPETAVPKQPVRRSLWQVVRPYLSAAAVVAVVALGTKALQHTETATGYDNTTEVAVATPADYNTQDELYSYLMLDDQSLYAYQNEQQ